VGVNLSIRQDLLEQIDRLAAEQGVTRSALIGELLQKVLSQ
jgi:metal-responsive CopG/Arc/MetJ family transcriptional regulator